MVKYEFRWNDWNIEPIAEHLIAPADAEYVVRRARRPLPEDIGDGKFWVAGQTASGRYMQVIYVFSPEDVIFVIHARPYESSIDAPPNGGEDVHRLAKGLKESISPLNVIY